MRGAVSQVTCVFDHDAGFLTMTIRLTRLRSSVMFPLNIGPIIASIDPDLFIACLLQNFVQKRLSSKSGMIIETVRFLFESCLVYQFPDPFVSLPIDNVEMLSDSLLILITRMNGNLKVQLEWEVSLSCQDSFSLFISPDHSIYLPIYSTIL